MIETIQFKRGLEANLPRLADGEPAFCEDTQNVYIGSSSGNKLVFSGSLTDYLNKLGDLTQLQTTDKDTLVHAINDNVASLAESMSFTKVPKLHHDFSNKANGSPGTLDTKQSFRIYDNSRVSSPMTISNGQLVHGQSNVGGTNSASYFEVTLDNKITRIGAVFQYPITANPVGSVTLASFATSVVGSFLAGNGAPDAGIHVTIDTTNIGVIIYHPSGAVSVGNFSFATPLSQGVQYTVDIVIDGQNLYLILPDGSITKAFTHSDIQNLSTNLATFELYESTSDKVPASIIKIWADDKPWQKQGDILNTLDMIKAFKSSSGAVSVSNQATTTGSMVATTMSTAYQTITSLSVPVPSSQKALVIASAYASITTTGTMLFRVSTGGTVNNGQGYEMTVGGAVSDGVKTVQGVISFPSAGGTATVALDARMTSGAGQIQDFQGGGKPVIISVIPMA